MPRPKNLKLGWTRKGIVRTEDSGFYPDQVVGEIAARFGIDEAEGARKLKQRLETAACLYLSWKHSSAGPLPRDIRAYFQTVVDRSQELIELIEKADDRSWELIWRNEYRLQWGAQHEGDTRLAEVGVFRPGNDGDAEGTIAVYSDLSDVLKHLRYLELLASECLAQIEPGTRGRSKNKALYAWVHEMSRFWEDAVGREFTVTYHQNVATSDAGQFLEACLAPMDREAVGQLVSQMREVLKDRKKRVPKK